MKEADKGNLFRLQIEAIEYSNPFNYGSKESKVLKTEEIKLKGERYCEWEYMREDKEIHTKLLSPSARPAGECFGELGNSLGQLNMKPEN